MHFAQMDDSLSSIADFGHATESPAKIRMQKYQIASLIAEDEIRQRGFEVVSRDDRFMDRPY